MAYDFDGTDDNLNLDAAIAAAVPFSVAMLLWANTNTVDYTPFEIADSAVGNHYFRIQLAGAQAGDPVRAITSAGGSALIAATTSGFSSGTWFHVLAVFAASNDRRIFRNGGSKGTNGSSGTPAGLNRTRLGDRASNAAQPHAGRIAEFCLWDGHIITDDEAAVLGAGPPWRDQQMVRPEFITCYRSLIREVNHPYHGEQVFSVNGASVIEHPPVAYRRSALILPKGTLFVPDSPAPRADTYGVRKNPKMKALAEYQ